MTDELQLTRGWTVPFFPPRPGHGPRLTAARARTLARVLKDTRYVFQPLLAGDRVLLAVKDRRVLAYTGGYASYPSQISNAAQFLKLDDGTLFDGIVQAGTFYPFECLALDDRSFKHNTTEERVLMALQMCRLLGVPWKFSTPTPAWLKKSAAKRAPGYLGVIRKQAHAPYCEQTSASGHRSTWVRYLW